MQSQRIYDHSKSTSDSTQMMVTSCNVSLSKHFNLIFGLFHTQEKSVKVLCSALEF